MKEINEMAETRRILSAILSADVVSYSRLIKEGKQAFHEFEVIDVRDGAVVYTPHPGGQYNKKNHFTLKKLEPNKATFENPAKKDFPMRATFHRAAPDRLVITLSDLKGGKQQVFDLKRN